ncbi:hypothetical protein YQE_02997, partial [Dendroctonus ponderosae]
MAPKIPAPSSQAPAALEQFSPPESVMDRSSLRGLCSSLHSQSPIRPQSAMALLCLRKEAAALGFPVLGLW